MSKICFLIAAHKNQNQLMRLINHLKKDFDIYVHIDKISKLNLQSFDNVRIYKKYYVHYAEIAQVTTTLFLIREAIKNNYDRYCFISGQDLPLKNNNDIQNFFDSNVDKEYISYSQINSLKDNKIFSMTGYNRIQHYNFEGITRKILHSSIRNFISSLNITKKKIKYDIYKGASWWNLTNNAIGYILSYLNKDKHFMNQFKNVWGCDEFFFQSILLNSEFKTKCINDDLRYIDWNRSIGSHPHTFLSDDYDLIKSNAKDNLFARKFDENIDNEIIDKLYKDLEY
ncbi:beta-1,6-N-acetylglucosaminyltransferase [Brachyspira hyodysenteriae]|uniref:beta-1,6-N-acetylglucosaminyltransferase n=2 Tax=Brachyspira hyodysenteriae TaxID=159 RepID=UPI00063DC5C5|nr:beta-1,6-N-acetylglucosaminyltransferase [Brachyspira hyodysenteriae]KLI13912.1 glycosyl transferase [Brachyspira hyodysenteriae]KLI23445.1 glycosyl transferase [Brachyspira hyodysenteriae]KLI25916.1 glycosyl transferase [Brachyspira hyodysenteriae]KLI47304.1 glycosyl transferase [Brachyspira hyodysenteriae]KLI56660.1 glycosyl transferase [Brachyspira hyodysenteriae]